MKITVIKERLLKAVSLVGQAIGPRPNLPILGNFSLSAQKGFLELTGTDLETTITYKIPVKVITEGKTTAPAKILVDFCQVAAGTQISLASEKDTLLVETEKAEAVLPTINPAEFPTTAEFKAAAPLEIGKEKLLESISSVVFNTSPEEGRPILTGVLFTTSGGKLSLVATDGYRLAKKEIKVEGVLDATIPARALQGAAKALAEQEDETVEISTNKEKNQARIATRDLAITSRLLEGAYPNYEQIIPSAFVAEVVADTKELAEAIKLTALFARDVGNVVRFEVSDKNISLKASTAQVGEASAGLAARLTGEKVKIAFNSRFLLECLLAIKSKETSLSFSGTTSATLLRGSQDTSLIYVVMPVRVQS